MKDWIRKGTEELRVRQHGETVVLSWKALEELPFVRQCFSTRQGGVSEGFLATMNFSFDRADAHYQYSGRGKGRPGDGRTSAAAL